MPHTRMRPTFRLLPAALAAAALAAAPAARAPLGAQVTIGTTPDAGAGYAGPLATAASGGTARYAQTFQLPGANAALLQSFTFNLGDFNPDASGAGLVFRASVYAVSGGQLGAQLYQSATRAGSGNYTGFDAYTFAPAVSLAGQGSLFAFVLEAAGGAAGARNVIATGGSAYAGGELFTVSTAGALVQATGTDAYFTAVFGVAPQVVPEPGTVALVAAGLAGLAALARRRSA